MKIIIESKPSLNIHGHHFTPSSDWELICHTQEVATEHLISPEWVPQSLATVTVPQKISKKKSSNSRNKKASPDFMSNTALKFYANCNYENQHWGHRAEIWYVAMW